MRLRRRVAHLEIGTFGESQGDLPHTSNYLEDGAKGLQRLYSVQNQKRCRVNAAPRRRSELNIELNPLILTCISEF